MKQAAPPILRHIANTWSLVQYPSAKKEWTPERKVAAIGEAGFDGFSGGGRERALAAKSGLIFVGYVASGKAADFRRFLAENQDAGAHHINVQLADEDTLTPEALRLTLRLMEEAEKLGVEAAVEVHRDTCTETPEKTYALADAYRKATGKLLPMTWDFSHLAVVKHLAPPYWERLLVAPKLVQHAQQFHFRPFNGHHGQVPVTNGKGKLTREIELWLPFLEKTIEMWLAGKQAGREMFAMPEMGPVPGGYNLSVLPNSWEDAKVLRRIIDKAWKKAAKLNEPARKSS